MGHNILTGSVRLSLYFSYNFLHKVKNKILYTKTKTKNILICVYKTKGNNDLWALDHH